MNFILISLRISSIWWTVENDLLYQIFFIALKILSGCSSIINNGMIKDHI